MLKMSVVFCITLLVGCSSDAQTLNDKITDHQHFMSLSGAPLSDKYGDVSSVKVVYDLETNSMHYINSKTYTYHYDYCRQVLYFDERLEYFNEINYSNHRKQRFLLANINYFESQGVYAMELSSSDLMDVERLVWFYDKLKESTFIGSSLALLVNSPRLRAQMDFIRSRAKVILPEDIYNNLTYQAIGKHIGYGTLRFVENLKKEMDSIQPTDIIVLKETPIYLPPVAGVIVNHFQTPLSHLTLLGQNRKVPICAYTNAFDDYRLLDLAGRNVRLVVNTDTFQVEPSKNTFTRPQDNLVVVKLKSDLRIDSLITISNVTKRSAKAIGNKAYNFAILQKLSEKGDFKTPESAFAIPFYFYDQHVKTSGAQSLIDKLLASKTVQKNSDSLKYYLKRIRKIIKKAPIDPTLLQQVEQRVVYLGDYTRMRFRSSTNAEDALGFSGAGLYDSKTGILNDNEKPIDKAIKKVWASLWSFEAFSERSYYRINHQDAYMGILVHRSFPSEKVNGVAITKNLYRKNHTGYVVNAQLGEESVVKPKPGVICDQFVCNPESYSFGSQTSIDVITVSNLNGGEMVMTEEEMVHLAKQLEIIKDYYFRHSFNAMSYFDYGMDVEFKLDGENRQLYIKQARKYND